MQRFPVLLLFLIFSAGAYGAPVTCPAHYLVPVARVSDAEGTPAGWAAFVRGNAPLRGAGVIDGPPEKQGELVPQVLERRGGLVEVAYSNLDANPSIQKWVSCAYGEGVPVDVTLARRLPLGVKHCVSRYRHQSGKRPDLFLGIDCE